MILHKILHEINNGITLLVIIEPYDFRNVENVVETLESVHKNWIYCIVRNVTEFAKFGVNKSKGQYT